MDFPKAVYDVVRESEAGHPDDAEAASEAALRAVQRLPEFEDLVAGLVARAVRSLVYDCRHARSVQIKKAAGGYGQAAKVAVGRSAAVERVYESVYQYRIGGTVLGDVTGAELEPLAAGEEGRAAGHAFNAELLRWCVAQGVSGERRVRDVIPEKRLAAQFARLGKAGDGRNAA